MKKWLAGLVGICLVLISSPYIFIPGTLTISKIVTINNAKSATNRFLLDKTKWRNWWPRQGSAGVNSNSTFSYQGYIYHITEVFTDKINVLILTDESDSVKTSINILPVDNYAATLQWEALLPTSLNPFKRILQYQKGVGIKKNMTDIFQTLQVFLEETSNVYGFPIKEIISKDSTLVATKFLTKSYPQTKQIYSLIDSMKSYLTKQGALQTDHPMLRVSKVNDSTYQAMIAIPANKVIQGNGSFFFLRFVPYKTLTGTVKGGVNTIEKAFREMEVFVDDHQRTSMAVPFQSLVTDRRVETDSLKWITVICQPVS